MKTFIIIFFIHIFMLNYIFLQTNDHIFQIHQINIHNGHNPDFRDFGYRIFPINEGYFILNFNQYFIGKYARQWNGYIKTDTDGNFLEYDDYYVTDYGFSRSHKKNSVRGDTIFLSLFKPRENGTLYPGIMALDMATGEKVFYRTYRESLNGLDAAFHYSPYSDRLYMLHAEEAPGGYSNTIYISTFSIKGDLLESFTFDPGFKNGFHATQLNESPDGTMWIAGSGKDYTATDRYVSVLIKIDRSGNILDQFEFTPSQKSRLEHWTVPDLVPLKNGNLIYVTTGIVDNKFLGGLRAETAVYMYNLKPDGTILWERFFESLGYYTLNQMLELKNGDLLGLGRASLPNIRTGRDLDYYGNAGWIFRLDREGNLLWERKILDPTKYPELGNYPFEKENRFIWFSDGIEQDDGSFLITGMASEFVPPDDFVPFNRVENGILLMTLDSNGCRTPDCSKLDHSNISQYFAPVGAKWYYRNHHYEQDHHSYTEITAVKDTFVGERHCRLLEVYRSDVGEIVTHLIVFHEDRTIYFYENGEFWPLSSFHYGDPLMEKYFYIPSNYNLFNPAIPYNPNSPPYPKEQHRARTLPNYLETIQLSEDNYYPSYRIQQKFQHVEAGNEYRVELGLTTDFYGSEFGFAGHVTKGDEEGYPGYLRCHYDPEFGWFNYSTEPCDFASSVINIPASKFNIFPNPALDYLRVSGLEEYRLDKYRIVNMEGRTVRNGLFSQDHIDVSGLAAGNYLLVVSSDTHEAKKQFTKF
ncbi:MAG: T9SS C-terminal target domain-containing protein [Saprospirales bacterium]|nr:MAG: T9SS C-terminal target domain-containing protein [Saprospirales bacterium]